MNRDYCTFWANFPVMEPPWIRRGGVGVSKHTEGPWTRKEIDESGPQTEVWAHGKLLATIYGARHPEGIANARLIAAAPDLLEACKALVADVDACYPEGTEELEGLNPYIDAIRAAIAAAEDTP